MFVLKLLPAICLLGFFQRTTAPPIPSASSAKPQVAEPSYFRISGRVIDADSGQPLARAFVEINLSNSLGPPNAQDSARVEVTGTDGTFVFTDVLPGKYVLSARRRGYIEQTFQQHETFTTAIVVGPGLDSENLIFGLPPAASISGNVTDEEGDPVRHAGVMLFRQAFAGGKRRTFLMRRASTDDEGHYHFGHLAPGSYFVGISAQPWYAQHNIRRRIKTENQQNGEGGLQPLEEQNQDLDVVYPVTFFANAGDLASAAPMIIHSGDSEIADFRLRPVPALHMLVKTSAEDPGNGTTVQMTQTVAENSSVPIHVGFARVERGLVEVTGLPPGRLNLVINTSALQGGEWTRRAQSVQLSGDTEVDATESAPSIVVSGILKMDDDSNVPQPARVLLRNSTTGVAFDTAVSPAGEFSFKNSAVAMGDYELMIVEPQALFNKGMSSQNAKTSGRTLQITTPRDVSVTVTASRGTGRITGFALKNRKPASGAMIVLAPQDLHSNPALFRRDQADSDGSFTLNAVVPGRYTVVAIENGWDLEWADPEVLWKYLAGGESMQIAPNGKTEVKVKVQ